MKIKEKKIKIPTKREEYETYIEEKTSSVRVAGERSRKSNRDGDA